jgi:hypothetical protein
MSTITLGTTVDFLLVRGDLLFRLQRSIRLIHQADASALGGFLRRG